MNTDDVHYAREIIGEYVQCHLGGDLWQSLHQKVRGLPDFKGQPFPRKTFRDQCHAIASGRRASGLFLAAAVFAPPPHRKPFGVLVDPLRDIRLRSHDALFKRHRYPRRELKMLVFALIGHRQRTHR